MGKKVRPQRERGARPTKPPRNPVPPSEEGAVPPLVGQRKGGLKEGARPTEPPRKPRPSKRGENPIPAERIPRPANRYPIEDGLRPADFLITLTEGIDAGETMRRAQAGEKVAESAQGKAPPAHVSRPTRAHGEPRAITEPPVADSRLMVEVERLPKPDPELRSYRLPTTRFAEGFFIGALIGGALCGALLKAFGGL